MNHLSSYLLMLLVVVGTAASAVAAPARAQDRLMPEPANIQYASGRLPIAGNFSVAVTGSRDPLVMQAAQRLLASVARRTGLPLRETLASDSGAATLEIRSQGMAPAVQTYREDESYRLEVTGQHAVLTAPNWLGALHGMQTFLQLIDVDGDGVGVPAVTIADQPRFPWRGLMLDVARHFMPAETVKHVMDGMVVLKLNTLHLHLSDDQGVRVESRKFPKFQQLSSDGMYYTQDQIREMVAYARERGIRVYPEFDMPGHTTAWFAAYPELHTAGGATKIETHWGIFDPCLDPSKEEVYKFLDRFIGEMAPLFPDEYFHIGGDEVNGKEWNASANVKAFKQAHGMTSNEQFHAYFNKRLLAIVQKHGKKMMGWDEILSPELPKDIMVQSWRGQKSLAAGARQGYAGILSNGYYLDLMFPAAQHYLVDPMGGDAATLTAEQKKLILGGEACQWAEYVNPEVLDSRLFPRLAAVAERLWSPQSVTDVDSMYRRLAIVSRQLEFAGMRQYANQTLMYKRLAGDASYGPVKVLGDIVEPVKEYTRGSKRDYTSATPLNRLIDTIWPESDAGRRFNALVKKALAAGPAAAHGKEQLAHIRRQLDTWQSNDARLQPILRSSALLREHIELSQTVARVAAAGLQAVDYVEQGQAAPSDWVRQQQEMLAAAAKPQDELFIMIVPGVQDLVRAAAGQAQAAATPGR